MSRPPSAILELGTLGVPAALAALAEVRGRTPRESGIVAEVAGEAASTASIDLYGALYGALAVDAPRGDLVARLAGTRTDAEAESDVFSSREDRDGQRDGQVTLTYVRHTDAGPCPSVETLTVPVTPPPRNLVLAGSRLLGREVEDAKALAFPHVALGGTFDRLHAGHRLLLAVAAAVATEGIYVGVTDDRLLQSKKLKHLIQPFEERTRVVRAFVARAKPGLRIGMMRLDDPDEPTRAETDPNMSAIVVSDETLRGAEKINGARVKKGFHPLAVVVIPVLGAMGAGDDSKLSSTRLRAEDARRARDAP